MNNLVMAYLGDAVFELYVREYLINTGICKVKDLQKRSIEYVSAKSQSLILDTLMNKKVFKPLQEEIIKRGRNAHSNQNKSTDIVTYKKSTGFECLIGYLYMNDKNRLEEIMCEVLNESFWKECI